ncbi:MAG: sodium/solute symporter [Lentisphaerota bacterium]
MNSPLPDPALFSTLNLAILCSYFAAMIFIGILVARRQRTTEDYFLAGRKMPWLVVAMSMYASLTSAVTYMGLPSTAYQENISLIVVSVISPLVAPFLIFIFYPIYRSMRVTTSYEYLAKRFGRNARFAASGLFILARLGWMGTVIYAPAMMLSVVTTLPLWQGILLMGLVATLYTALGGIAADIWTDVVQFIIMIAGAAWLVIALLNGVPGGFHEILRIAGENGRLQVLDWHFSWYKMTGAAVALSFFFQLLQDYGTDQTTVQRLMTTPDLKSTVKAIVFNACTDFIIVATLLFIGIGMFAYYCHFPERLAASAGGDSILPYYIIHALPNGISGLLVTAIFAAAMSSMDSGISSLSTVIVNDFVRPLSHGRTDHQDLNLARGLVVVLGILATAVAFYVAGFQHIIKAYTSFISLFSGPVLALFLLGMLTRRAHFKGWLVGCAASMVVSFLVQYVFKIHWIYFFPFSFGTAFLVGLAASYLPWKMDIPAPHR